MTKKKEPKIYDVVIIGAGPAGMTAAIYLGRADKTVLVIDKEGFGGNIARSPKVENIPGFKSISGVDFATNMYEQMLSYETVEHEIAEVALLRFANRLYEVFDSDNHVYYGKSIIIATGTEHKQLKLDTKNVYYCATCDGPFFKNKNVLVVGSGNTGAAYALELATYCKNVYICDITHDLMCEPVTKRKLLENEKIHWLPNCAVKSVTNDKDGNLTKVTMSTLDEIGVKAIFAAVGQAPKTDFAGNFVDRDANGYIIGGNLPGIFVAGDCLVKTVRQVTTAVSDGTVAAISASKYVEMIR